MRKLKFCNGKAAVAFEDAWQVMNEAEAFNMSFAFVVYKKRRAQTRPNRNPEERWIYFSTQRSVMFIAEELAKRFPEDFIFCVDRVREEPYAGEPRLLTLSDEQDTGQ